MPFIGTSLKSNPLRRRQTAEPQTSMRTYPHPTHPPHPPANQSGLKPCENKHFPHLLLAGVNLWPPLSKGTKWLGGSLKVRGIESCHGAANGWTVWDQRQRGNGGGTESSLGRRCQNQHLSWNKNAPLVSDLVASAWSKMTLKFQNIILLLRSAAISAIGQHTGINYKSIKRASSSAMQLLSDDTPLFLALPLLSAAAGDGGCLWQLQGENRKEENIWSFQNRNQCGNTERLKGLRGYRTWQYDDSGREINATSLSATPQIFAQQSRQREN